MKRIWMVISTIALANMLAVAGFIVWLKTSDRLDGERLTKIRALLGTTITVEKAKLMAEETVAADEAKQKAEADKLAKPPQNSAQQIAEQARIRDIQQQDLLRLQQELRLLKDELATRERALAAQRAELDAGFKKLAEAKTEWERTLADTQFKAALGTLEAQKAKDTKATLQALMDRDGTNAAGPNRKQVITYLAAMDEEVRAKVMGEFIKTDAKLAAELLEQLRTRGIDAPAQAAAK